MPDNDTLTAAEQRVLAAVQTFIAEQGLAPTGRELAVLVQVSNVRVHQLLARLEHKGRIRRVPKIARGIFLTGAGVAA